MHGPISIEFGWGQILNLMFDVQTKDVMNKGVTLG